MRLRRVSFQKNKAQAGGNMSEAMTNSEIEDVLSSIRRLVAQEVRPEPRKDASPAPERLVLTAELRVGQANLTVAPTVSAKAQTVGPAETDTAPVSTLDRVTDLMVVPTSDPQTQDAPSETVLKPDATSHADLEAAITELESALGQAPPMSRPAADAQGDTVSKSSTPMPDVPPATVASGNGTASDEPRTDDANIALIDEDELQALVARLVRAELRGQLGERITQQVRKLVRAEIARALDERNLLT
jgi:hypothetical protein